MSGLRVGILLGIVVLGLATGCSGSSDNDPNYKTEVTLSPEQQAAEKANMAGQKAPGSPTGGPGATPASIMPMPHGKGK